MVSKTTVAKSTVIGIIPRCLLAVKSARKISRDNIPKELWNTNPLPQEEIEDESDINSDTWTTLVITVDPSDNNT